MEPVKVKAVFLDRDGVINEYPGDFQYVTSWEEFKFLPKIEPPLKKLIEEGYLIFIISNQAGVSKGLYTQEVLNFITQNMKKELVKHGVNIYKVYYCTHHPDDNCYCRKPKTGLIDMAITDLTREGKKLDIEKSYFIGDSILDIQTGKSAGLKTILVFSGREKPENKDTWVAVPDLTAKDLPEAIELILK